MTPRSWEAGAEKSPSERSRPPRGQVDKLARQDSPKIEVPLSSASSVSFQNMGVSKATGRLSGHQADGGNGSVWVDGKVRRDGLRERVELTEISLPRAVLPPAVLVHQTQDQPSPSAIEPLPLSCRQEILEAASLCCKDGRLWDGEELSVRGHILDRDEPGPHSGDLSQRRQRRDCDPGRGEEREQRSVGRGVHVV